jgi:hypothetical protein
MRRAPVLIAHPSLTGMNTGSGLFGSTDWHNGPRARLYFERRARRLGGGFRGPESGDRTARPAFMDAHMPRAKAQRMAPE